jgi:tRNA(Met) C34 N-acetyltransferase TmcA
MSEWGNPSRQLVVGIFLSNREGEPSELKHLSRKRRRKQDVIPQVVASERGAAQTLSLRGWGVVGSVIRMEMVKTKLPGKQSHRR